MPNFTLSYVNARSSVAKLDLHIDSGVPFMRNYPTAMQFVFIHRDSNKNDGCTIIVPKSGQFVKYSDRSPDVLDQFKVGGNQEI